MFRKDGSTHETSAPVSKSANAFLPYTVIMVVPSAKKWQLLMSLVTDDTVTVFASVGVSVFSGRGWGDDSTRLKSSGSYEQCVLFVHSGSSRHFVVCCLQVVAVLWGKQLVQRTVAVREGSSVASVVVLCTGVGLGTQVAHTHSDEGPGTGADHIAVLGRQAGRCRQGGTVLGGWRGRNAPAVVAGMRGPAGEVVAAAGSGAR